MLALAATTIAWLILVVILVGWVVYLLINLVEGRKEIGSEVELAPNRSPGIPDEELEGPRLERAQLYGVLLLAIITVGLPLYWIFEPDRQAGAIEGWDNRFVTWGSELFATTADGGFNCAGCHGGMAATGGVAQYAYTEPTTGETVSVAWKAPALDTVYYKFTHDEVKFILEYGRPFSPMSPWGLAGGGPLNDQQIETLLAYLESIQIPREGCDVVDADPRLCEGGHLPVTNQDEIQATAEASVADGTYDSLGEALFNMNLGSGTYSCARCHTAGWSFEEPEVSGGGALGPNLTGGSTVRQFPSEQDMIDFITSGSEYGKRYGQQGQGTGRMPAFGAIYTDDQIKAIVEYVRSL